MELTSKQRAQLRSMANDLDTIVHVGKDGVGENLIKQADDALEARELIKGKVLEQAKGKTDQAGEIAFSPARKGGGTVGDSGPRW